VRVIDKEKLWNGNTKTLPQWLNVVTRNVTRRKLSTLRWFEKLSKLTALKILHVGYVKMSEEDVEKFKKLSPNVKVVRSPKVTPAVQNFQ